jgi:hypothetical protein
MTCISVTVGAAEMRVFMEIGFSDELDYEM